MSKLRQIFIIDKGNTDVIPSVREDSHYIKVIGMLNKQLGTRIKLRYVKGRYHCSLLNSFSLSYSFDFCHMVSRSLFDVVLQFLYRLSVIGYISGIVVTGAFVSGLNPIIEQVVATVNGEGIFLSDLEEYSKPYIEDGTINNDRDGLNKILDVLIDEELIFQVCEENDVYISEDYIDRIIQSTKEQLKTESDDLVMKYMGVPTVFHLRRRIKVDSGMLNLLNKSYMKKELTFPVKVPDDTMINDYYKKHDELYGRQEERKISHIILTYTDDEEDKKRAMELIQNISNAVRNGRATFEEMAIKYSEDYFTKDDGGSLGYFRRYQLSKFSKEYEDYAFKLSKGGISPVIEIDNSYLVIKVDDIVKSDPVKISRVADEIYLKLLEENFYKSFGSYFDKFKDNSIINKNF